MSPKTNSFKVFQASAGSGKTYTIVKEYLELCLKSPKATSNFNQILAITFTNMAANEMKAKIVRQLDDLIHNDPSVEPKGMEADLLNDLGIDRNELKENATLLFRNILHDYSSFCVSTIDAFVQKLSRSFAKDLNLPSQFSVSIDENEVADAITERIGEQIGPDNPYLTEVLEDYSGMKFNDEKSLRIALSIHEFITKLFSEETFQQHERNQLQTETQYNDTKAFLLDKTKDFASHYQPFVKAFEGFIARHKLSEEDFNYTGTGPCMGFLKMIKKREYKPLTARHLGLLDGSLKWYNKKLQKKAGDTLDALNEEFQQVFLPYLRQYHQEVIPYLFYHDQLNRLSLYALRSIIKKEMDQYIGEEQMVPISEFNKRINEMMGDFTVPFIYERLGERFTHLFIDEFQDTSVLQWQNLIPLLDNTLSNNSMSMVVGDGKQSIYRWRNGEVGQIVSLPRIFKKPDTHEAFDDFERNLIQHFDFTELKSNYRSFRNIVEFNNHFFQFCADQAYLDNDKRKVYEDRDEQFQKEVSVVQQVTKNEEGTVQVELFDTDPKEKEPLLARVKALIDELLERGFSFRDITVLVRDNKNGSLVANYLNERGIPVISADSILLKNSYKVQLILHTLEYLIHSDNKAVIATVLYDWHLTHDLPADGVMDGYFDHVDDIAAGRRSLEEELGLKPLEIKSLLYKSYSLYDLCSALARVYGFNTLGDSYLNFLLDLVFQWQQTGETGIEEFLAYWEKKKGKLSVLSSQANAVNVMTIHKSKGLEFNVVIYPFMSDDIDENKGSTLWIPVKELGFEAIPNIEKVQFSLTKSTATWTPETQALAEEEASKIRLDNLNLTYVAFTRPKQRLHVLSYQKKEMKRSPLNAFLNACEQDKSCQVEKGSAGQAIYRFGDPLTPKVEERVITTEKADLFQESRSSDWSPKVAIDPNPSMFWISDDNKMKPQEWGDFVHQVLSEVRHADDIDRALFPYLDAGVIDPPTADLLRGLFAKMVREPMISAAFLPEAKVKTECEVYSPDFGIRRPDRYAELPDAIYLLDYKTGKKTEEHPKQLQEYRSVLKKIIHKNIKTFLVYLGDTLEVIPVN